MTEFSLLQYVTYSFKHPFLIRWMRVWVFCHVWNDRGRKQWGQKGPQGIRL